MLVEQIKKGNVSAYKELFSDYYPILCCFAEKFLSNEDLCKDVAQDALLKYWENRVNFNNIYQVKSFLYIVTKNLALNLIKKSTKLVDIKLGIEHFSEFDINNSIIEHETQLLVRKAINTLPKRMKEIIEYSMMGMQNSDIAERLSIAEGTVHTLKKRAYKKLKSILGNNYCYLIFL